MPSKLRACCFLLLAQSWPAEDSASNLGGQRYGLALCPRCAAVGVGKMPIVYGRYTSTYCPSERGVGASVPKVLRALVERPLRAYCGCFWLGQWPSTFCHCGPKLKLGKRWDSLLMQRQGCLLWNRRPQTGSIERAAQCMLPHAGTLACGLAFPLITNRRKVSHMVSMPA